VYGFILLGLIVAWGWGVTHRTELIAEVLRDRNALYREVGDGQVENSYTLKLVNKGQQDNRYRITLQTSTPGIVLGEGELTAQVDAEQVLSLPLRVAAPDSIRGRHEVVFHIESLDGVSKQTVESSYFGPMQ
jgi:polyferredoxin